MSIFEEHEIVVSRVLTDRATEFCGKPEHREYELYLAIENIDHTRTKGEEPTSTHEIGRKIGWESTITDFPRLEELSASRGG